MISKLKENVALAELTTLKIGGKARFFLAAENEDEICEAVRFAEQNKLELFVLGGGSNVLISDEGFNGLVLQIALKGVSVSPQNNTVFVSAGAGEDWDKFVEYCVEKNLQGVECLSGIPGLVGGTPVQNVGAYGQEVSETITSVRVFDREKNSFKELSNGECGFAYRKSLFNTTEKNRYIVLAVTYALTLDGEPKIVYRDLQNYFGDNKPSLKETRRAVLDIRAEKSMVIDAHDPNSRSAGSFFKNPLVTKEKFAEVKNQAVNLGFQNMPYFVADEKCVKIPAAWLIEKSGFEKGYKYGRVGISTNHSLAIVNFGGATAAEILDFKDFIQAKVKEKFDVDLKPEPVFVGFPEIKKFSL